MGSVALAQKTPPSRPTPVERCLLAGVEDGAQGFESSAQQRAHSPTAAGVDFATGGETSGVREGEIYSAQGVGICGGEEYKQRSAICVCVFRASFLELHNTHILQLQSCGNMPPKEAGGRLECAGRPGRQRASMSNNDGTWLIPCGGCSAAQFCGHKQHKSHLQHTATVFDKLPGVMGPVFRASLQKYGFLRISIHFLANMEPIRRHAPIPVVFGRMWTRPSWSWTSSERPEPRNQTTRTNEPPAAAPDELPRAWRAAGLR